LFGGTTGGFCLAAPPVVPWVIALPIELCFAVPPIGFCLGAPPTGLCVVAPPITGPGFAAPPSVLCFAFVAPPTAF
jgi:hypothetical protein